MGQMFESGARFFRRTMAGLTITLVALLARAQMQSADSVVERHFAAAQHAQKAGELDAAAREYQEIVRLEPGLAEVHANLGLIYYAQSRFEDSAKELKRAAQLKPSLRDVNFWLAVDEIKLGRPETAVPLLDKAIERNPRDEKAQKWLGTALWNSGQMFAALDQLAKTSRMYPEDTEGRFMLEEAYRKAGDREIESILASAPGTPLYHQIYGDIYKDLHSWDRATAHYSEALKIDPHWKGAHLGIAEVDAAEGKLTDAKAELQQELIVNPNSASARAKLIALTDAPEETARLGIAEDTAGAPADTEKLTAEETVLRHRLEQHRDDLEARYALARVFKGQSLAIMNTLIREHPDSPRMHQLLGQTYEDRLQQRQALAEYRIVEEKEPSLPGIHYKIGHLLWQFGDHANALAELNEELKLNPESAEANGEIGSILLVDGESAKAIPYLETALRSDPSLALIHRQLGKAYAMQRNYSRAEAELKQAIETDTDGSALYQLGMVYRAQGRTAEAAKVLAESQRVRAARLNTTEGPAQGGMAQSQ